MNMKTVIYLTTIFLIEIQLSISLPFSSENNFDDDEGLIPERSEAYFLDDHGKPVLGLFDSNNSSFPRGSDRNQIRFHLYTKNNPAQNYQLFVDDIPLLHASPFNSKLKTIMLIHGFTNTLKSDMIQKIKDAYLRNLNLNVIAVDWGDLCGAPEYVGASERTMRVGQYVAQFVDVLVREKKLNLADLHIVGHSLGAHTAGIVGKHVTTGQIARITGLDPALPLYSLSKEKWRLTTKDARFVDVIHTSGGDLGFLDPIGHIDFYPNGGVSTQPGCGWDLTASCSHSRSWEFFAESVNNKNAFATRRCGSLKQAQKGQCDVQGKSPNMGEYAYYDNNFNGGLFHAITNDKSPYSRS